MAEETTEQAKWRRIQTDKRASHRTLLKDLTSYGKMGHDDKVKQSSRFRNELRTLSTCPSASKAAAFQGIIMQRFFGGTRTSIRPRYRRDRTTPLRRAQVTARLSEKLSEVLAIPELLERVLYYLPIRDLILATRVDKRFRTLIASSPTLKEALFLLPQTKVPEATPHEDRGNSDEHPAGNSDSNITILCPLLDVGDSDFHFDGEDPSLVAIHPSAKYADAFVNMQLTDPPCKEVGITLEYTSQAMKPSNLLPKVERETMGTTQILWATRTIRSETGVTFAALLEATYMKGDVGFGSSSQEDPWLSDEELDEEDDLIEGDAHSSKTKTATTLHNEIMSWEKKFLHMMFLDFRASSIRIHGPPGTVFRNAMEPRK